MQCGSTNELVLTEFFKTMSSPILSYGIDAISINNNNKQYSISASMRFLHGAFQYYYYSFVRNSIKRNSYYLRLFHSFA